MPKVIFKFDKERDLYNIWETCNFSSKWDDFRKGIPKNILDLCEGKEFEEIKDKLEQYLKKNHSSPLIPTIVESFNKSWSNINDDFFKRIEKIMKKPFVYEKVIGYLTSVRRCPYNYGKDNPHFLVNLFGKIDNVLRTAGHEIMHIQFHNTYWPEIEKKIGKEKTADLKEALTVLLNLEFKDLGFVKDEGYPAHKELRDFIEKQWKKNPDFDVLLEKCVEYLKE